MRQDDVMLETRWKIKNWEAKRQAYSLQPEHYADGLWGNKALGRRSIHAQTSLVASPQVLATPNLVSSASSPTIDPDESLWPRG